MWKMLLLSFLFRVPIFASSPVVIEYFFQAGCGECARVERLTLPLLEEHSRGRYELRKYDVGNEENYLKLLTRLEQLRIDANDPVCMIVGFRHYLGGFDAIDRRLPGIVEQEWSNSLSAAEDEKPVGTGRELLQKRAAAFTVGTVAMAGMLDGFNPCAFTTLVFFLSLLAVSGIRKGRLLAAGSVYCLACLITYIALGFGLSRFLRLFTGHELLRRGLELLLAGVLLVCGGLSFLDAWRFRRTGCGGSITLQLPDRVKALIHAVLRGVLRKRYFLPALFLAGCLVTFLESACTGQVYVPTLVLMARESGGGWRWFRLLLLYNFMFILPLLVLFAVALRGTAQTVFLRWSRRNVVPAKIALGCFFWFLAGVMLV